MRDETHWDMFDADVLAWKLEQGPDRKFFGQLFEIRAALEPLAASLAAIRRSDEQALSLEELASQMNGNHDRQSFTKVDVAFHKGVLEASDNPFLLSIGAVIETALAASFMLSAPTDDLSLIATAKKQHLAIARAISQRSPQAAATAMRNVVIKAGSSTPDPLQPAWEVEFTSPISSELKFSRQVRDCNSLNRGPVSLESCRTMLVCRVGRGGLHAIRRAGLTPQCGAIASQSIPPLTQRLAHEAFWVRPVRRTRQAPPSLRKLPHSSFAAARVSVPTRT